jgi:hypothetical protein
LPRNVNRLRLFPRTREIGPFDGQRVVMERIHSFVKPEVKEGQHLDELSRDLTIAFNRAIAPKRKLWRCRLAKARNALVGLVELLGAV